VPMVSSLKIWRESAETISVRNACASFIATAVLPTAVGPATTINVLLLFFKPGKIVKKLSAYSLEPTACADRLCSLSAWQSFRDGIFAQNPGGAR
jgi:hypothetical protein